MRMQWILISVLLALSPLTPSAQSAANPEDALLDVLVWGTHMPIDPKAYSSVLRADVEQYLRRAMAYRSKRAKPSKGEAQMPNAASACTSRDSRPPEDRKSC